MEFKIVEQGYIGAVSNFKNELTTGWFLVSSGES